MRWLNAVIVLTIGWIGHRYGGSISLEDQWPYFEALRTTTSIVFGVMGALLAIIYPEVLKTGFRGASTTPSGNGDLNRILAPCAHSALLLIMLVSFAPLFAWIKSLELPPKTIETETLQQWGYATFCVLSYWQISILLMVLRPLDALHLSTNESLTLERLRRGIHSNGRG